MKPRNSNHEMLRLVAMYMIILIHANMYLSDFYTGNLWHVFNGLVNGICNTGVTCFILISGYYGIKFDLKKLVKLECMMISYSLIETSILFLIFPEYRQGKILLEQFVKSLLPFVSRKYWFYSCYICLFLLSGYIEKLVENLTHTEFKRLLLLSIFLFSVLPTLFYFEIIPDNGKGLVQMLMIYMIGRYIKLFMAEAFIFIPSKKMMLILGTILWMLNGVTHEFPIEFGGIYHHLCKDNSITNLVMAVIIFFIFKDFSFQSRLINRASSYIFAAFALNNSLITVFVALTKRCGLKSTDNVVGFLGLLVMVLGILFFCIIVGMVRESIWRKCDEKLAEYVKREVKKKLFIRIL